MVSILARRLPPFCRNLESWNVAKEYVSICLLQTKSLPGQCLNNLLIPSIISIIFHNPDYMIIENAKIKIVMDRVPFLHGGKSNIKL